ncbi:MAG: Ig-like domain-containing protein [Lachnospiraceae bacterium]|nr:Ig-like domain-containing protein [Lachnospiraceae bacterium]
MISYFYRKKRILCILMAALVFSALLAGCDDKGKGAEDAEVTEEVPTGTGFDFESEQSNASPQNTAANPSGGMTSEELLNSTPTAIPANNGLANIPSNIEVENTGSTPATVPAFDSSSVDDIPDATPTVKPTASGITLSPTEITIYKNSSQVVSADGTNTLTATMIGGTGTVLWSSTDTFVASVAGNGATATVTGINPGTCLIKAEIGGTDYFATAVIKVVEKTPDFFDVGPCMINVAGEYSAKACDELIAKVNGVRADYGIPACTKNASLCKVADVRAKEIAFFFANVRPNGAAFNSVAPLYYKAECIACILQSAGVNEAMAGLQNYTTTRVDIMNEKYGSIGASYFMINGLTFIVLAFGN